MNMAEHCGPVKGRKSNMSYHSARSALNMKFHFKTACINLNWGMEIKALMRKFSKQSEIFSCFTETLKFDLLG